MLVCEDEEAFMRVFIYYPIKNEYKNYLNSGDSSIRFFDKPVLQAESL